MFYHRYGTVHRMDEPCIRMMTKKMMRDRRDSGCERCENTRQYQYRSCMYWYRYSYGTVRYKYRYPCCYRYCTIVTYRYLVLHSCFYSITVRYFIRVSNGGHPLRVARRLCGAQAGSSSCCRYHCIDQATIDREPNHSVKACASGFIEEKTLKPKGKSAQQENFR